jgi:hemoglobin-like flavoprotein
VVSARQISETQMTPQQQTLVQSSFALVAPIADQAAVIFYDDLFRRDPKLRALFKGDMAEQRRKLMAMLGAAVANLQNWEQVAPVVRALGRRHVGYGVTRQDYDSVGAALIQTLETGLGEAFTPEIRDAWIACYGVVARDMLAGDKLL